MVNDTDLIVQDWDSFRIDFISSTDNTATSAMNKMTNDFIYYFEKGLRANKIGIPAGIFSNDPIPTAVEGFYKKDVSKELAIEALLATQNFFKGKYFNSEIFGASLESYLSYLLSFAVVFVGLLFVSASLELVFVPDLAPVFEGLNKIETPSPQTHPWFYCPSLISLCLSFDPSLGFLPDRIWKRLFSREVHHLYLCENDLYQKAAIHDN